jgi:hypothetical protein
MKRLSHYCLKPIFSLITLPNRDQLQAALAYYAMHLSSQDVGELVQYGDGWNFRQIARRYVSGLDLSQLEANEPPLPGKEDYLATLRDLLGFDRD